MVVEAYLDAAKKKRRSSLGTKTASDCSCATNVTRETLLKTSVSEVVKDADLLRHRQCDMETSL